MADRRKFKGTSLLKMGLESIRIELNYLDEYIEETARTLDKKQEELESDYRDDRRKSENEDEDQELDMFYSEEFRRYHELFPTFTYNSMLVSQFSFFESRLKFICELYSRNKLSKIRPPHLNGSDMDKHKQYLTLVAELNFNEFQDMWKRITDIQKLRNLIVHHSSRISTEDKNLAVIKYIKSEPRIVFTEEPEGDFYINDVTFHKDFSKLIFDFFKLLVDKLSERKIIARNNEMPYDNANWGQEKMETLMNQIVSGIKLLDENNERTDEFKDSDMKHNIKGVFHSMAWNVTKLYSFFCAGQWEPKDRDTLIKNGKEGIEELRSVYGGRKPEE
jgi:hypothetical protein